MFFSVTASIIAYPSELAFVFPSEPASGFYTSCIGLRTENVWESTLYEIHLVGQWHQILRTNITLAFASIRQRSVIISHQTYTCHDCAYQVTTVINKNGCLWLSVAYSGMHHLEVWFIACSQRWNTQTTSKPKWNKFHSNEIRTYDQSTQSISFQEDI